MPRCFAVSFLSTAGQRKAVVISQTAHYRHLWHKSQKSLTSGWLCLAVGPARPCRLRPCRLTVCCQGPLAYLVSSCEVAGSLRYDTTIGLYVNQWFLPCLVLVVLINVVFDFVRLTHRQRVGLRYTHSPKAPTSPYYLELSDFITETHEADCHRVGLLPWELPWEWRMSTNFLFLRGNRYVIAVFILILVGLCTLYIEFYSTLAAG